MENKHHLVVAAIACLFGLGFESQDTDVLQRQGASRLTGGQLLHKLLKGNKRQNTNVGKY